MQGLEDHGRTYESHLAASGDVVWSLRPRALGEVTLSPSPYHNLPKFVTLAKLVSRAKLGFIICKMGMVTVPITKLLWRSYRKECVECQAWSTRSGKSPGTRVGQRGFRSGLDHEGSGPAPSHVRWGPHHLIGPLSPTYSREMIPVQGILLR